MAVVKALVDRIEELVKPEPTEDRAETRGASDEQLDAEAEKEAQRRSVWDVVNKAGRGPMSEAQMNNKEDVVEFLLQRMVTAPAAAAPAKEEKSKGTTHDASLAEKMNGLDLQSQDQQQP